MLTGAVVVYLGFRGVPTVSRGPRWPVVHSTIHSTLKLLMDRLEPQVLGGVDEVLDGPDVERGSRTSQQAATKRLALRTAMAHDLSSPSTEACI